MRNMMACTVSGGGAGVAAAVAVKTNANHVPSVDIAKVQNELKRQGVELHLDSMVKDDGKKGSRSYAEEKAPLAIAARSRL